MRSVNKVTLLGHVGRDPEIKQSGGGVTIANFSLATSYSSKAQNGNKVEHTEWHNLVAFNKTAEIIRDWVKKGAKLYVEGMLQTQSYDDKSGGAKRYRTQIIVRELSMLGDPPQSERGSSASPETVTPAVSHDPQFDTEITDDDIPF